MAGPSSLQIVIPPCNEEIVYVMSFLYKYFEKSKKEYINTTFLQKAIFFLSRGVPILEESLDYRAHRFGPHSYKLEERVIDMLVIEDILEEKIRSRDKIYFLGEEGPLFGKEAFNSLDEIGKKAVEWISEQLINLTLDELLALTYYTHDEMTKKSEIKDEIEAKRVNLAISLLRKGKISHEKATEISGLTKEKLEELI